MIQNYSDGKLLSCFDDYFYFRAHVVLILGRDENCERIVCKEMEDLRNYTQVNSPGTYSFCCWNSFIVFSRQNFCSVIKFLLLPGFPLSFHLQYILTHVCIILMYSPLSLGTVLKAAFFCADILTQKSRETLKEQLLNKYKGGFELQTWSDLPHGSGLGTSSILAGTILAALWKSVGKEPDLDSVIHAVSQESIKLLLLVLFYVIF